MSDRATLTRRLTGRLSAIAAHIPSGSRVADIGTDHGFLPIDLALKGCSAYLVLTDIRSGPLARAGENLSKAGLIRDIGTGSGTGGAETADARHTPHCDGNFRAGVALRRPYIALRLGDGLVPVSPHEVDIAVIAGMGGEAIAGILAADPAKTLSIGLFVLQPRTRSEMLRRWIYDQGYHIIDEDLAREGSRICEIIIVRTESAPEVGRSTAFAPLSTGEGQTELPASLASDIERSTGLALSVIEDRQFEKLMSKGHPLLRDFIRAKLKSERAVLAEMEKGGVNVRPRGEDCRCVRRVPW